MTLRSRALILLADPTDPRRDLAAATLSWMCEAAGVLFDSYYPRYALGYHYGVGDADRAPEGAPQGSSVVGGRHHQHFWQVQAELDCTFAVLETGQPLPMIAVTRDGARILCRVGGLLELYGQVAGWLRASIEEAPVVVARGGTHPLSGLSAYAFPEIWHRRALALAEPLAEPALDALCRSGRRVFSLWCSEDQVSSFRRHGLSVTVIDAIRPGDDHAVITTRIADRWADRADGYMIGDPDLVSAWIPWLCRRRRVALYGQPNRAVIERTESYLRSRSEVWGRQSEDWDILRLSELGQPMELVDPNRPVLPALAAGLRPVTPGAPPPVDGTMAAPSDQELRRYAEDGKVLATLIFWSGALREIETIAGVIDLVAVTRLRAGIAIGARAFEYGGQACLDLLYQPLEYGGVYSHLEVLLGSSGLGPAFEGLLGPERLGECLGRALDVIRERAGEAFLPRGWYAVMDGGLERLDRIRAVGSLLRRPRNWRLAARPYWDWRPTSVTQPLLDSVSRCGFQYAISKTHHGWPAVIDIRPQFIAINHTAGVWEGWSPFVDLRSLDDLLIAERKLVRRRRPGWLLSSIDTCLWTFSYHQWERGTELKEIGEVLAQGGDTGELLNVTPEVVARYARVLADMNLVPVTERRR